MMRAWSVSILIGLATTWTWAQPASDAGLPDRAAVSARGLELQAQRDALDKDYKAKLKQCYQEFNVSACRNEARENYTVAHRALRKLEVEQGAQERQIKAADARQRLSERQTEATERAQDAQRAQQAAADRAANNAQKQSDHIPEATKRAQYDQKQREAEQRREELAKRERQREKPRSAPLPVQGGTP